MERVYKLNHSPDSGRLIGRPAKEARRAAAVVRILELLAERPMTAAEVRAALYLNTSTAFAYLHYMASQLRQVRKTGTRDAKGRELWELGEDPTLPTPDQTLDLAFAQRRSTVPARQVGMWRDSLVAALFGPSVSEARL
ncbi:hypothetical protein [Massilia sp. DD77]|uniref:hypothetical protein n=1 Tax=Massilia sp. DD77 TaxID=3109349 RepID=UPI002FFF9699